MFWNKNKKKKLKSLAHIELVDLLKQKPHLPAIWRNRDHDAPVIVIGYYGQGPETLAHYVQVEGSLSGIPLNELLF